MRNLLNRLKELGVGYRQNYGGPFESKWPHSHYTFTITIDRDGVAAHMDDPDGRYESHLGAAPAEGDLYNELYLALAQTLARLGEEVPEAVPQVRAVPVDAVSDEKCPDCGGPFWYEFGGDRFFTVCAEGPCGRTPKEGA